MDMPVLSHAFLTSCLNHLEKVPKRSFFEHVLVAQLDRVSPSEGEGQAFESPRAHHFLKP